jgi:pimeloyl-ACP methyl ester carboxylesterase
MRGVNAFRITAGSHELEVVRHGPSTGPQLVFLHEGLGSVSAWRAFPFEVAERAGLGCAVYSRWGYGLSDPVSLPRPVRYMHDEAETLVEVLRALHIDDAILFGHSDGASIALLYAGAEPSIRLRGLALEAPHVFVEDVSVESIAAIGAAYETGDLRDKLARHHQDVDGAFRGWNRVWLDPAFRDWNIESALSRIDVPMLLVQGEDDEYGTLAQLDAIERGAAGSVERVLLPSCGHAPHRDQPEMTRDAMVGFVDRLVTSNDGGQ